MEGVKTEGQDDSSQAGRFPGSGPLGKPLQREQTVPAVPHYKVSAGPPGQIPGMPPSLTKGGKKPRP